MHTVASSAVWFYCAVVWYGIVGTAMLRAVVLSLHCLLYDSFCWSLGGAGFVLFSLCIAAVSE